MFPRMPVTVDGAVCLFSSLAGIAFHHLYTRRIEIDFHLWQLVGTFSTLAIVILYSSMYYYSLPLWESIRHLVISVATFALSTVGSVLLYRGHFHRLGSFPGPYLARLSSFYAVIKATKHDKYHLHLLALHQQYGDVVRVGPRQLSVTRADCLQQIHALKKGTMYAHLGADHTKVGFILSRDIEDHKRRRRPWERGFSPKSLQGFDERIQRLISLFLTRLSGTVNVTELDSHLLFDTMGVVGFSRDFGNLSRGTTHPALITLEDSTPIFGRLRFVPWLLNMLLAIPGAAGGLDPFLRLCDDYIRERRAQYKVDQAAAKVAGVEGTPDDVMSWLIHAMETGDPGAPPSAAALADESRAMVHAGAETAHTATTNALWFLAANQNCLSILQQRLDVVFPGGPDTFSYAALVGDKALLTWLDAIINETLRLRPPILSGNPKLTPPQGLLIPKSEFGPGIWIPGDVEVVQPQFVIHRDARWFERPNDFLPERWAEGDKSDIRCDKSAWFPFTIGRYTCVGKPLAMHEMRSIIARVALEFDFDFAIAEDWEEFEGKMMDNFTMSIAPLHLNFKKRAG
ncbi:cytochrome P450 [Xylariales sp. AK1849]|nr:cytochrome P450 [Xylariales sp. AK1849]